MNAPSRSQTTAWARFLFLSPARLQVQAPFDRGVALLHDFWYAEARPQFERIAKADPGCAMAHWGIAMSVFHQIWDRPDDQAMKLGWAEIQKAQSLPAKTRARARLHCRARHLLQAGQPGFHGPRLSLLGSHGRALSANILTTWMPAPSMRSLCSPLKRPTTPASATSMRRWPCSRRSSLRILTIPALVHYIIHSCDNPCHGQRRSRRRRALWRNRAIRAACRPHARTHLRAPRHVATGYRLPARIHPGLRSRRRHTTRMASWMSPTPTIS